MGSTPAGGGYATKWPLAKTIATSGALAHRGRRPRKNSPGRMTGLPESCRMVFLMDPRVHSVAVRKELPSKLNRDGNRLANFASSSFRVGKFVSASPHNSWLRFARYAVRTSVVRPFLFVLSTKPGIHTGQLFGHLPPAVPALGRWVGRMPLTKLVIRATEQAPGGT